MVYFPTREKYFDDSEFESIFLNTEDNVKIHCYWCPAKDIDAPILLSFHGNAENANMGIDIARRINEKNVSVILADYRGYGKSEGTPSETGTYKDAKAYYDFALTKTDVDKIVVHGRSLGSAVAVNLAVKRKIAGLILESALTTAEEVFHTPEHIMGVKYRSIDIIDEVKAPVLIIHGEKDVIVPFWMGEKLYANVKTEKEIFAVESAGHNDLYFITGETYIKKVSGFVKRVTGCL